MIHWSKESKTLVMDQSTLEHLAGWMQDFVLEHALDAELSLNGNEDAEARQPNRIIIELQPFTEEWRCEGCGAMNEPACHACWHCHGERY
jgi:hypothetical protein